MAVGWNGDILSQQQRNSITRKNVVVKADRCPDRCQGSGTVPLTMPDENEIERKAPHPHASWNAHQEERFRTFQQKNALLTTHEYATLQPAQVSPSSMAGGGVRISHHQSPFHLSLPYPVLCHLKPGVVTL